MNVVDLTDDPPQGDAPPAVVPPRRLLPASVLPPSAALQAPRPVGIYQNSLLSNSTMMGDQKRRALPASVLPPGAAIGFGGYVPNRLPLPQTNVLPGYRYAPVPPLVPSSVPNQAFRAPGAPAVPPAPPNAKIIFSIVNSRQFTARAEAGHVSAAVINMFRSIEGAKFDWQTCKWLFPLSAHDNLNVGLRTLRHPVEALPRLTLTVAQLKNERDAQLALSGGQWNPEESLNELKGLVPDSVLHQLAPFQRDAVAFVMRKKGRALVADEMGLGKTRTAIASAMAYRDDWPVLVVSPSSARHHWQAELLSVLYPDHIEPRDITIVESSSHPLYKGSQNFKSKILIISYHLISKLMEVLLQIPFNVIIVDESHYMKSATAQRTRCLIPLLHKSKRAILLSGTPALSRPIELFTQLHALAPEQWKDLKEYGRRYCVASKSEQRARLQALAAQQQQGGGFGAGFGASGAAMSKSWAEFNGASNTEELHLMLSATIMIRRLKKDILAQLPEKQRRIVRVPIQDPVICAELKDMLTLSAQYQERQLAQKKSRSVGEARQQELRELEELRERKKHVLMTLFTKSGEAKLPAVVKQLEAFLDDPMSGKVLVFCHHRAVMDGIARVLTQRGEDFIRIDGQTPSKERHARVQQFQNTAQCRVGVLAITAAGIALTLTAASTVYFAELFWTPAALLQAEDRAHRIGQVNIVKVTYFLAKDSVDKLLWPMVRQKMKLLGEIVEGSKDGDFLADLDGPDTEEGAENGAKEGAAGRSGRKRMLGEDVDEEDLDEGIAIKDEGEVEDVAKEIADELRNAAREERKSAGKGSSSSGKGGKVDKDSDEDSSGAEDGEAEEDDGAVVAIEEPDQLALLYMNMARAKVKASNRAVSSTAVGKLGVLAEAALGGMSAAPVSLMSPDVKIERTVGDEDGDVVTLLSAEEEAAWRSMQLSKSLSQAQSQLSGTQGSSSSTRGSESQVIDLMDEYAVGESAGEGCEEGDRDLGLESTLVEEGLSAAEFLADEEVAGEALGGAQDEENDASGPFSGFAGAVEIAREQTPQPNPPVYSNIVQDEGDYYSEQTHKGTLEALAQKAWSSAAPAQTPKNNKMGFKFAPSLKKTDRNDSSSSLGRLERTIEAVGFAPPVSDAVSHGTETPAEFSVGAVCATVPGTIQSPAGGDKSEPSQSSEPVI